MKCDSFLVVFFKYLFQLPLFTKNIDDCLTGVQRKPQRNMSFSVLLRSIDQKLVTDQALIGCKNLVQFEHP